MDFHRRDPLNTTDITSPVGNEVSSLAVCIPTFRNPEGLQRLLESIKGQQFRKVPMPEIEIFVVDNDSDANEKRTAEEYGQSLPFPLHYQIEKKRGIPFARNKLVELASGCDLIAFIDDDEEAGPHWLDELLYVHDTFKAEVVTGPVLARFEIDPPAWAVVGKFYESARRPTGSKQGTFFTNNLLIESAVISQFPRPFEESMALSGGTDSLFAMRVAETGVMAVWADEAIVYEYIPATRTTKQWYFRRRYRIGSTQVQCDRFLPNKHYKVRVILRAIFLVWLGVAVIISSVWKGQYKVIRGIGYWCTAAGMMTGALGLYQQEYGRDEYRKK